MLYAWSRQNLRRWKWTMYSVTKVKQFRRKFRTERDCTKYLIKHKWPDGFVCPKCGHDRATMVKTRHVYQCKKCHHQASVTARWGGRPVWQTLSRITGRPPSAGRTQLSRTSTAHVCVQPKIDIERGHIWEFWQNVALSGKMESSLCEAHRGQGGATGRNLR